MNESKYAIDLVKVLTPEGEEHRVLISREYYEELRQKAGLDK